MKIRKSVVRDMIAQARKEAPVEACGYLAAKDGVVTVTYALTNVDQSNEHFSLDPAEQFSALKDARAKGLQICAVYHSHPQSPARPSAEDIKKAFDPDKIYVIVSLANGQEDIRAYRIRGEKVNPERAKASRRIKIEPLEVIGDD